jgi:hypothetical protein
MLTMKAMKLSAIVLLAMTPLAVGAGLLGRPGPGTPQPGETKQQIPLTLTAADDKANAADAEMREDAEMHVIGVYSAKNMGEKQKGSVEVEVRNTSRPIVLVLTSYYSVDWHVKLADGARIKKAILSGCFAQEIRGLPAGIPVENWACISNDGSRRKEGWFWASNWNTPQWREMVRRLNKITGLPVASFQEKSAGDSFIID